MTETNEWLLGEGSFLRPLILPVWLRTQTGIDASHFDVINAMTLLPFPSHPSNPRFFFDQKVRKTHYLHEQSKYLLISLSVSQMRDGQNLIKLHAIYTSGNEQLVFGNRVGLIWVYVYIQNIKERNKGNHTRRQKCVYFYLFKNQPSSFPKDNDSSFHLWRHFKHSYLPINWNFLLPKPDNCPYIQMRKLSAVNRHTCLCP